MCNSYPRKEPLKIKEIVTLIKALFTNFLKRQARSPSNFALNFPN